MKITGILVREAVKRKVGNVGRRETLAEDIALTLVGFLTLVCLAIGSWSILALLHLVGTEGVTETVTNLFRIFIN